MDNIIELKNVTKIYGQKDENLCVLEDVSLQVQKGRFVVLLGPSGSGKSTLLNLIAMLDKPTSGQIFFEGQDITRLRKESARSALRLKKWGLCFSLTACCRNFLY